MKCSGKFVYKGIEKKDGGEFTNEKGKLVKYEPMYQILVDEDLGDNKIIQRRFKFPLTNKNLYDVLIGLKPYTDITLYFDVNIYNSSAKLVPIDVECTIEELED